MATTRATDAATERRERPQSPAQVERAALERLRELLRSPRQRAWSEEELVQLPRLYRLACSVLARLEAEGARPRVEAEVRRLVALAQVELYRHRDAAREGSPRGLAGLLAGLAELLWARGPRAIRAEWRLLLATFVTIYGLAGLAFVAVQQDLELSYSLLDPTVVDAQIQQLEDTSDGEPFRGNFTFGLGESPQNSAWIMVHNMGVGVLFFAAGLLPPFYLLLVASNALMIGTYTAVAGHWGQAGSISSILWCHGVLEIQAFVLAGTAGLVLFRALLFPGVRSRRVALVESARRATDLFLPTLAILFVSGLIEGFVSPHAPLTARLAVAVGSGVALVAWALLGGRDAGEPAPG